VALLALMLACPGTEPEDSPQPDDSSPLVEDSGDPALPEEPPFSLDQFASSSECAACHPDHVEEWSQSRHAYAMEDPLFQALSDIRRAQAPELEERFCLQCHSAIGVRTGDIGPGFEFSTLDPLTMEGITCTSCHTVTEVFRPGNAGHRLDPTGPMRGPIEDPVTSAAHASEGDPELFESAAFCASCHEVTEESGLPLERPYAEWLQSPAGEEGRPCQSCHMPERTGPAALGGPDRRLHSHRWLGVEDGLELLEGSATVVLDLPEQAGPGATLPVVVTVRNEVDAHAFPTGTTFLRQFWLELTVYDGDSLVYSSGELDELGDLQDHWSEVSPYGDPDLVSLSSGFLDADGQRTLFTHEAAEHGSPAISPLHEKTWSYLVELPAELSSEELSVGVRLRFREAPPFLMRLVGLSDALDVTDIDAAEGTVQVLR
jgi:hypothetical protein